MPKNIFVVGLDDFNHQTLKTDRRANEYRFHPLFYHDEVQGDRALPFNKLLQEGQDRLAKYPGTLDAILGYWDFPVTGLVSALAEKFRLPGPSLESVIKCEHKGWSRIEQQKAIPEHIPEFYCFNPFDDHAVANLPFSYPFWIKPIKATDSLLGFKIRSRRDLDQAIHLIRTGIGEFSGPFNQLLQLIDLPPEIAAIDGSFCIAEKIISGRQCTVEGYVFEGAPHVHGIVDSFRYPGVSSFLRYQYPSRLPGKIREKLADLSKRVMRQIGLNNSAFNIEFFVDRERDQIWLLEINPRISQSHADSFQKVDGASNHEIIIDLALGRKPAFPFRRGRFNCAAKFYLRAFEDGTLSRVPTEAEIRKIEKLVPGTRMRLLVKEGQRLSELHGQDSYSYVLGDLYIGGRNTRELLKKFIYCRDLLPFEIAGREAELSATASRRHRAEEVTP